MLPGRNSVATRQHKQSSRLQIVSSPPFCKFFEKLSTHSTLLCKLMTVSENGKYAKLQIMDYNNIWHVSFFVLKIFSQSIFS